jgi:hypothetical protein
MYAKRTKLNHGTYQIAGWVGLRAILDILKKRAFSYSCRNSNPGLSSP